MLLIFFSGHLRKEQEGKREAQGKGWLQGAGWLQLSAQGGSFLVPGGISPQHFEA